MNPAISPKKSHEGKQQNNRVTRVFIVRETQQVTKIACTNTDTNKLTQNGISLNGIRVVLGRLVVSVGLAFALVRGFDIIVVCPCRGPFKTKGRLRR